MNLILFFLFSIFVMASDLGPDMKQMTQELQPLKQDARVWQKRLNEFYDDEDPSFKIYQSPKDTVSITTNFALRRKSADRFSSLSLIENRLSRQRYFTEQTASGSVPNHVSELGLGTELRWLSERDSHPDVTLSYDHILAERRFIGTEHDSFRGYFDTYSGSLANHFQLNKPLRLTTELDFTHRENHSNETKVVAPEINESSNEWGFRPSLDHTYTWGVMTYFTGASIGQVRTIRSANDSFNTQTLGLRATLEHRPIKSMYEIGAHRFERSFNGQFVQTIYQPFVTTTCSGLYNGRGAISLGYQLLIQSQSNRGPTRLHPQKILIDPSWDSSWTLYKNLRLENATLHFPIGLTYDDGVNDRVSVSTLLEEKLVIGDKLKLRPSLTLEYARYYRIPKDDFGVHVGLKL